MDSNQNLQRVESGTVDSIMQGIGGVAELIEQIQLIQRVMRETMKDGEHYGTIPGCGEKKALKKPGAEKLSLIFRMVPEYAISEKNLEGGHREIQIVCSLFKIGSRVFLGQGVGSCSTMENKYRYRTGPKESTGKPVPREYWDLKKLDPIKAAESIGGRGFNTSKNPDTGAWEIVKQGEKVETDNPAEQWNTVLKMAKKRAHVDAVLTATAASDIFTQDLDDDEIQPDADGGTFPEREQRNQPANQSAESAQDWREVTVHFGSSKGKRLGDLAEKPLAWLVESWVPSGHPATGQLSANDLFLRKACDAAAIELGMTAPPKGAK